MNARHHLLVACALALPGAAALAEPHLRPGLWEQTVDVKSDDPKQQAAMEQMKQMRERMASMPPEQRAMMEKMMSSHGVAMGAAGNSIRVCITKEQADRGFTPQDNGHCSRSNVSSSGNTTRFDFACKSEHAETTGHGVFVASGDSAFTATAATDIVTQRGKSHMDSQIAGKFISTDCGDVKPVTPPAK